MSRKKKRTDPAGWTVSTKYQAPTGRWLEPGSEVHIKGERGRFKFVEHVSTPTSEWVWVTDKDRKSRAFSPERISRVHVQSRMR